MRILYLHQYFTTPQATGGTRSYEFARRLVAAGHEVCVVTSSARFPPEQLAPDRFTTSTTIDGIEIHILRVPYANAMSMTARIRAFVQFAYHACYEVLRIDADLVFATSTPLTIAIPALLAKLRRRVPMVFEVRDLWPELPIAVGKLRNPLLIAAARALEWVAYHASSHVIALSPGMAEGVVRRGIAPDQITVIPNSCDISLFDVPSEDGREIRAAIPGLVDGAPLIVYTGTFGLINGVSYLVDVAAEIRDRVPQARFVLVGGGAERETVRTRAQERGVLDQNLFIWDPLPKARMPALLAAADVATSLFLPIPEMWHNSANKFFDALAAGRPIAINYGGWQAELIERTNAGLVLSPDDPTNAAHQLASFVLDPERMQRARQASRQLARCEFDRDAMAERLRTVFERVTVAASQPH